MGSCLIAWVGLEEQPYAGSCTAPLDDLEGWSYTGSCVAALLVGFENPVAFVVGLEADLEARLLANSFTGSQSLNYYSRTLNKHSQAELENV